MGTHEFAFEIVVSEPLEGFSARFFDALEGALVERAGQTIATVLHEAGSPVDGAHRVIGMLEALGASVVRVDQDLVDSPEIAARLDVSRQTVNNWATGKRGCGFPRPVGAPGGKRIWTWGQVVDWLRVQGKGEGVPIPLTPDEAATVDAALADRRARVSSRLRLDLGWMLGSGFEKQSAERGLTGPEEYARRSFKLAC